MNVDQWRTFVRRVAGLEGRTWGAVLPVLLVAQGEVQAAIIRGGRPSVVIGRIRAAIRAAEGEIEPTIEDAGDRAVEAAVARAMQEIAGLQELGADIDGKGVGGLKDEPKLTAPLAGTTWLSVIGLNLEAAIRTAAGDTAVGLAQADRVWTRSFNSGQLAIGVGLWGVANRTLTEAYALAARGRDQYQRQAVAAIDEKTTLCCLRVHGQIVGIREAFTLTGEPRFADRMQRPPFHWNCRTSVTLYHALLEGLGVTTAAMRTAASDEVADRWATGRRVTIHPAHATSRR